MTPPPAPLPRSKTMDTQTIQHYEDTISRLRQELSQSPQLPPSAERALLVRDPLQHPRI